VLDIKPGIGLGNLRFGDSVDETARKIGQPVAKSSFENVQEFIFSSGLKLSFRNGSLYQIGASHRVPNITFHGRDIFSSDSMEILRLLEKDSSGAYQAYGFVVFLPLGVSLTGFHDEDIDEKAMTISVLDEWESVAAELTPVSFL
jgi:hypothetical protein